MMTFFQEMVGEGLLVTPPKTMGSFEEMNGAYIEGKVATVLESRFYGQCKPIEVCSPGFGLFEECQECMVSNDNWCIGTNPYK